MLFDLCVSIFFDNRHFDWQKLTNFLFKYFIGVSYFIGVWNGYFEMRFDLIKIKQPEKMMKLNEIASD